MKNKRPITNRNNATLNGGFGITEEFFNYSRNRLKATYGSEFDDDLFQDSLIKLLSAKNYVHKSMLSDFAFLSTIYRNLYLDVKRRNAKFKLVDYSDAIREDSDEEVFDFEDAYEDEELLEEEQFV